jgi:hypothetical protein
MKKHLSRRRFLRGVGGVSIALPALDIFTPKKAHAQAKKIYAAFLLEQNGAVQGAGEPDMFWPRAMGAISATAMEGVDMDRTTSELKAYASKLNFIRGTNFRYSNNHDAGGIAALSAAPIRGSGTSKLPVSESADFRIAREMTPGKEPLTLYVGKKNTFRDDAFSFGAGGALRVGDNNPSSVYQRLSGIAGMVQTDPGLFQRIAARRLSINDLVRNELKEFLGRTDLSKLDRERLDVHLTSVRDMEMNMTSIMGTPMLDTAALMAVNGSHTTDPNFEKVTNLQIDLIAFAFASDRARTATLQIGGMNSHARYTINGVVAPPFHFISHRVQSDGGSGPAIANAVELHHQIDRIHARHFKHLCDKFSAYSMPDGGTLLDNSVNVWTNSVSNGPPHSGSNVPYVLAGGAGGFLKTGNHIRLSGTNAKILNTIISACGVRKPDGGMVDNFGDPSPAAGEAKLVSEIIA